MGSSAEADLGVGSGFERVLYAGTFRRTVVTDQVSGSAPFGSLSLPTHLPAALHAPLNVGSKGGDRKHLGLRAESLETVKRTPSF